MLSPYSRSKFVEKILTDKAGREFRVLFFVTLVNGEVIGRPVSMKLISPDPSADGLVLSGIVSEGHSCLPAFSNAAEVPATPYISPFSPIVSPYADIELEAILTSQPTRAPSLF